MDTLISFLTSSEFLTVLGIILSAVGVPSVATKLIVTAAPVAVNLVEQTMGGENKATPEQKKAAAVSAVRTLIPMVINVLPGTKSRIEAAVEAAVYSETN